MNDSRLTPRARNVLRLSHEAAGELGHSYVGTEHLLLGLLGEEAGGACHILQESGLSRQAARELVVRSVGTGAPGAAPPQGLTPRARRAIEYAAAEAQRSGSGSVGTEHLLLGLLREGSNMAVRVLRSSGMDIRRLQALTMQRLNPLPRSSQESGRTDSRTKVLNEYAADLTAAAREGRLDPVICREKEIDRAIQILSRRTKNNPVLIGEPGVGKTAVAEGLAMRIVLGDVPEELADKRILSLDLPAMLAGTKYRGEFEERVKNAVAEVKRCGNIILFLDELHTIVGAGSAEGSIDAGNIVKPALGRGEIRVIGATTLDEYRKYIEKDAALERRFQPILVEEPSRETALTILRGLREKYEAHHHLAISDGALQAAVELSCRYIHDRFLPDKAIDLVDEAAAQVRLEGGTSCPGQRALEEKLAQVRRDRAAAAAAGDFEEAERLRSIGRNFERQRQEALAGSFCETVGEEDIARVVSRWTGVPVTQLTEGEAGRLLHLEDTLRERVIGQEEAVAAVARAVRRSRVGMGDPKRPVGSFLLLGPTGVGKTELCRALAEALFGREDAMIRIDMSEYMERHSVSRLIGAPPGYVGHDEGGQLTEKVRRRPYSVVLLDEMEKAHEDVWNLLLQVLEDGMLTDGQGRQVDFRSTVVMMTSNIGARAISRRTPLGFSPGNGETENFETVRRTVMEEVRRTFRPELINRVDDVVVFHQLSRENLREIARRLLRQTAERAAALGVTLEVTEESVEELVGCGLAGDNGARPLRRAIRRQVEDLVAEQILSGAVGRGDTLRLSAAAGALTVTPAQPV